jgi:hypothetical protein
MPNLNFLNQQQPKFATIPLWSQLSGMSRSGTYEALAAGHLQAIKLGNRTLIDVEPGLAWLRSLPPARIRSSRAPKSAA